MMDPLSQVVSAIVFMYIDFFCTKLVILCLVYRDKSQETDFILKILISIQGWESYNVPFFQTICIGFSDVIV
jgi:hypothetical protein